MKVSRSLPSAVSAFSVVVLILEPVVPLMAQGSAPSFHVLTWQIDFGRTGQNLTETTLTTSSVQTGNFGQLCHVALDGQVHAQPLIVTNVTITINGVPTNYACVGTRARQIVVNLSQIKSPALAAGTFVC